MQGFNSDVLHNRYDAPVNTEMMTVSFIPANLSTEIRVVSPKDADVETEGYQVRLDTSSLYSRVNIQLLVTAVDGTQTTHHFFISGFACHEDIHRDRVAPDGRSCVILRNIIVGVAEGYNVDEVAERIDEEPGWSSVARLRALRVIIAKYSPDELTLEALDAERKRIARIEGVLSVERDSLVSGGGAG